MMIEGHFTQNEIRSAVTHGATVTELHYRKVRLNFPDQERLGVWLDHQKQTHPEHWTMSMVIPPKPNEAKLQ